MNEKNYFLDFSEHPISTFDKKNEKIPRQYSVVYPIRTVYPETQRNKLSDEVRKKERAFLKAGVSALVKSEKDVETLALTIAKLKYGANHTLFHDLGVGIHTGITRPNSNISFFDVRHFKDDSTGKIAKTVVTVSLEGLYKLALGPLVNNNGRAISGAGPVVKEQKKRLSHILYGEIAEPIAAASVNTPNGKKVVIYGKPIIIDKFHKDAFHLQLDNYFFPVVETEDALKMRELHLHHVAGLSSVLSFGRYLLNFGKGRKGDYPETPEAHKVLLYLQAACEMYYFAPGVVKKQAEGRYNFVFRKKPTVKELRPDAIRADGYIRWKDFSTFIAKTGIMYGTALKQLDILDHLHPKTLVPATDKGAQFPKDISDQIVYIKADTVKKALEKLP